jgi:hypothetical protein
MVSEKWLATVSKQPYHISKMFSNLHLDCASVSSRPFRDLSLINECVSFTDVHQRRSRIKIFFYNLIATSRNFGLSLN